MQPYYTATDPEQTMALLEEFVYSELHKYLVIIDPRRGADILEYLSMKHYPVRVVIDIDTLEDVINCTCTNESLITKSVYIRPTNDLDTQGIIQSCGAVTILRMF
jgi:hypothetical protein